MAEDLFLVKESAELGGRYGVAKKDLKAGDIVFKETPFAVGPKTDSYPVCLSCNAYIDCSDPSVRCSECGWPLCADCNQTKRGLHAENECKVFKENGVKFQSPDDPQDICHQLDCITPLRVLLAKERDPERWTKEIEIMQDHEEERKSSPTWEADENNVVKYIRGPCKQSRFSEELIRKVIGILETNAFEARTLSGNPIRCLYPKLAIFSHSCIPNLTHSITVDGTYHMTCRAAVDVPEGGTLNTTYSYTLWGTAKRQEHLKKGKYFVCKCERCKSPTELNTHFSSLKCNKCDPGLICTTDPYDEEAEWKCSHCDFKSPGRNVAKMIETIEKEIAQLDYLEYDAKRLQETERLFKRYRSVFHPNHYIQIGLRQQLISMYGVVEGYEMLELPDVLLEHKIELIRQVMKVLDVVEPGKSRARGMMLFELHVPLIFQAKSTYAQGLLEGEKLREKFRGVMKVLEECAEILKWEDENSPEGQCAKVAEQALIQLQESLNGIED